MRRARAAVLAALVALVTAACSGVPRSSAPEIVSPVRLPAPTAASTISPQPGADPQTIVTQFLDANASSDARHSAARAFLTPDAQRRWSDATLTVVTDPVKVTGGVPTVTVNASRIGTIDEDGTYSPDLVGDGSSGDPLTVQFQVVQVSGQWRIDQLPNGLIVTESQFTALYRQRNLYFLDVSESRVVPDVRYTALAAPGDLAGWLVAQLAAGPRPYLQNAVQDDLPSQADPRRVTAAVTGTAMTVEIPGASQLDGKTMTGLAAQLATTLDQAVSGANITVTDGGRPVPVPLHPKGVTATDLSSFSPLSGLPPTNLYYIANSTLQSVAGESASPVPGALGHPVAGLTGVALGYRGSGNLLAAATVAVGDGTSRLLVGRMPDANLADSGIAPSALSRPVWAPGPNPPEVWVGAGAALWRVPVGGGVAGSAVTMTPRTGAVTGSVTAVAFSVDGARVALVISSAPGRSQVWMGSVVRSGTQARVDGLQPVTPPDVEVTDVAWNDPTTLYVTGTDHRSAEYGIWDVQSDGSLWRAREVAGLPAAPTAITAALEAFPVVQADGRLWQQRRSTWIPLFGTGPVPGTSPTYLQ